MKRPFLFLAAALISAALAAQGIPELFQKAKEQVKASSWPETLKTLDQLDAEASKPGNENVRKQLQGPMAFYRGVCDANLDQADKARADFAAFLQIQPNASIDPGMYSKKAVAAFEQARKTAGTEEASPGMASLFTAYQEFNAPANISEPPTEKWADGPVRFLLSADEKRQWSLLSSGGERGEFVEKFWAARNPTPGANDNPFRTGFERRVAFADAKFVQDEKQRGSLTDRGMVFVLLGPPTWVGRKPLRTGDDPSDSAGLSTVGSQDASAAQHAASAQGKTSSTQQAQIADRFSSPGTRALDAANNWREVWHYRRELLPKGVPYQQVDVEFITKKGYGVNVLQRESQTTNTLDAARTLR
jgi:GWxTD domain-containing protein